MKKTFSRCPLCNRTEKAKSAGKKCNRGFLNPRGQSALKCNGIMQSDKTE